MNYFRTLALTLVVAAGLAGCSTSNVTSSADPDANFSAIRTYNFVQVPDTDGKAYQSIETGYLRTAVSQELNARGWTEQANDPDTLVNFSIKTQEKIVSRPTTSNYGAMYDPYYDAYYEGWGTSHQTRIDQYTEGQLFIDLIDPQARKVIWQGSTKGRLTQKMLENAQATLNEAVAEIFSQFPVANPNAETK